MAKSTVVPASVPLSEVRRRIENWRRTRRCRTAMPEELWLAAAAVAHVTGLNATARALRLDYYSLKQRLERSASQPGKAPAFVEVRVETPLPPSSVEYLVELERPDGGLMRARLSTLDSLAVLSDSFWRRRS